MNTAIMAHASRTQFPSVEEQMTLLMRGVEFGDAQTRAHMESELRTRLGESRRLGRALRVYVGIDPTGPDITLGHTVPLRKLRQFQELGHQAIFLVGTMTALIGDPSDKEAARRQQSADEVERNARSYLEQAFKILDPKRTEVRRNGEWLSRLDLAAVIELASHFTIQQFLARDNFARRHERGDPIWVHELFYALMQARDAVELRADVQIGGTEQLFNLMAGRKLQEALGQRPQVALTYPILVGTDGHQRMSKSAGNYVGVTDPPEEQYGKTMSLPDTAMLNWFSLVTSLHPSEIERIRDGLADGSLHPMDCKKRLAREIASAFHGEDAARRAEAHFERTVQHGELPPELAEVTVDGQVRLIELMTAHGLAASHSEARRLVEQGGVRIDGRQVLDPHLTVTADTEHLLQVGKRRFLKLKGRSQ